MRVVCCQGEQKEPLGKLVRVLGVEAKNREKIASKRCNFSSKRRASALDSKGGA